MSILPEFGKGQSPVPGADGLRFPESAAPGPANRVYGRVDVDPLPPASNTGVTNTRSIDADSPMVSLDWLSFTIPPVACISLERVLTELTPPEQSSDDWTDAEHGGMGYRQIKLRGGVRVYHDGGPGMGIHVSLSGDAVRQVASEYCLYTEENWKWFLSGWRGMGAKFTRIDGAIDTFAENALDIALVCEAAQARHLVTAFHNCKRVTGELWELHGERGDGREGVTLYFGSATSQERVRIYDKGAERYQAGDHNIPRSLKWTRTEIVFKKEAAEAFLSAFLEAGFSVVPAAIKAKLDFKTPNEDDSNKSRWDTAPWWDAALGGAGKLRLLVTKGVQKSIEATQEWVKRQVPPSLALCVDAIYRDCEVAGLDLAAAGRQVRRFLSSLVEEGRTRYRGKHRAILGAYRPSLSFGLGVS